MYEQIFAYLNPAMNLFPTLWQFIANSSYGKMKMLNILMPEPQGFYFISILLFYSSLDYLCRKTALFPRNSQKWGNDKAHTSQK